MAVFSSGHVSEATHKSYVPSDKGPTPTLVEQMRNLQKKPSLLPGRSVRLADAAATERRAGGRGGGLWQRRGRREWRGQRRTSETVFAGRTVDERQPFGVARSGRVQSGATSASSPTWQCLNPAKGLRGAPACWRVPPQPQTCGPQT